jgi:hypothetical protein
MAMGTAIALGIVVLLFIARPGLTLVLLAIAAVGFVAFLATIEKQGEKRATEYKEAERMVDPRRTQGFLLARDRDQQFTISPQTHSVRGHGQRLPDFDNFERRHQAMQHGRSKRHRGIHRRPAGPKACVQYNASGVQEHA